MLIGKNKLKMLKKALVLFFAVLFSIESLAAVVSDNDGAAFVTKAEFEALKKNFAEQIENYNTSIDSKIDGAIANYLAGTKLTTRVDLILDKNCKYSFPMSMFSNDLWNDQDANNRYYSVSTPRTNNTMYAIRTDFTSANPQWAGMIYVDVDPSNPQQYAVPNMREDSQWWVQILGGYEIKNKTEGADGFLLSVGDINGERTINGNTYGTRERLTAGYGRDIASYVLQQKATNTGGGHNYEDSPTAANLTIAYHYSHIIGFTDDGGSNYPTRDLTRRKIWTKEYCPRVRYGIGAYGVGIKDISSVGWTYQSFLEHYSNLKDEGIGGGWCVNDSYSGTPNTNVFSWSKAEVVDRVFAGTANLPAEKLGNWKLTTDPDLTLSKSFRNRIRNDNTCKDLIAWSFKDNVCYARGLYSFNYDVEPYFIAADNDHYMPNNDEYFSKLPAQLVYYYDSNNKKHFMDEGMFLQTFDANGTVYLTLKFTGLNININLSKKPFDYQWTNSDNVKFKINNVEYANGYNTASNREVTIVIEDILKGEELYLRWAPSDGHSFCQLDSIPDFYILAE